jgi:hypothetical protein
MKLLLVAALLLVFPLQAETTPAGLAAKVNGDVITAAEVDAQVNSGFFPADLPPEQREAARQEKHDQVLHALIVRKLILQAFAHENEKLPDGEVDRRLDAIIAEEYGGDRSVFVTTLKERGIPLETYRQEIADSWVINHMRQKHTAPQWSISLLANADIQIY